MDDNILRMSISFIILIFGFGWGWMYALTPDVLTVNLLLFFMLASMLLFSLWTYWQV
jgi:hypothetical protein